MQQKFENILTKYLSKEASSEEESFLFEEIKTNKKLKAEFEETKKLWESFNREQKEFDKKRIQKLIALKIALSKKQKRNKFALLSFKYAAIFIGLLFISTAVYTDLTSVKSIVNNTSRIKKITLPDNSVVTLNKGAEIKYGNSVLAGFNREVKLTGEAFFEVTKKEHKKFVVKTSDYNITVLGTKFNVRSRQKNNFVVLCEGKIVLDKFKKFDNQIVMKPGQIVKFSPENNSFIQSNVNPEIYTSWMKNRLEFDNFSINDLAELLKIRYRKTLIVNNKVVFGTHISGSAPSDDVNLIIKALKSILKTEIIQKNDTVIIN